MEVTLDLTLITAIAGVIIAVGGACVYLKKMIDRLLKPFSEPLAELQRSAKRHDELLDSDNKRIKELEAFAKDTQRALTVLLQDDKIMLEHMATNNATGKIQKQLDNFDDYLINKK